MSLPRRPDGPFARALRLVTGAAVYPAAVLLLMYTQHGIGSAAEIVVFVLPGVVFGALIRRRWIIAVPAAAAGAMLLVGYIADPTCASCGDNDTWANLAAITAISFVLPATISLLLGSPLA